MSTEDENDDWLEDDATELTNIEAIEEEGVVQLPIESITAPRPLLDLPGWEPGWKQGSDDGFTRGYRKGREEVLDILRDAFRTFEQTDDVAEHVIAWICYRLPPV